jgi:hypothetical protein
MTEEKEREIERGKSNEELKGMEKKSIEIEMARVVTPVCEAEENESFCGALTPRTFADEELDSPDALYPGIFRV